MGWFLGKYLMSVKHIPELCGVKITKSENKMETNAPQRLSSKEFTIICRMLNEIRAEIRDVKSEVHNKLDRVSRAIKDSFEGFGILDADKDTWTVKEISELYNVSKKTVYTYRNEGKLTASQSEPNGKLRFRKADVIEFFAMGNA